MRLSAVWALMLLCAACGGRSPESAPTSSATSRPSSVVNPARIDRARDALPDGYEVSRYTGLPAPVALWGFTDGVAVADPAECLVLGAPAVDPATSRGWSASGPGGIVYAVVSNSASAAPGVAVRDRCARWTLSSGRTVGIVDGVPAPAIEAAQTLGMSINARTVVEGGTETHSRADTFVAYLGAYVCFVALVTDPGSPHPALGAGFASHLLAETVSALRG